MVGFALFSQCVCVRFFSCCRSRYCQLGDRFVWVPYAASTEGKLKCDSVGTILPLGNKQSEWDCDWSFSVADFEVESKIELWISCGKLIEKLMKAFNSFKLQSSDWRIQLSVCGFVCSFDVVFYRHFDPFYFDEPPFAIMQPIIFLLISWSYREKRTEWNETNEKKEKWHHYWN